MGKTPEYQKRATANYLAKRKRANLTLTFEQFEEIKQAAAAVGESMNTYILGNIYSTRYIAPYTPADTVQDSIGQDTPAANPEPYQIPPEVLAKIEAHREPPPPALPLPPDDIAAAPVEVLAQWLHDHGYTARQIREYLKDNRK